MVLAIIGGLIYLAIWYSFRTTSEDVSNLKPFSKIIGKELITKQPCFIAYNYKHVVKKNSYIIAMKQNKLSGNVTELQELPVGTLLKVTETKRFTNGVTGFKSTYVLGSVYLENFQREVEFEFAWGSKNYGTDLKGNFFSYSLAPWQDKPLEVMYDYEQGIERLYQNYNQKNTP